MSKRRKRIIPGMTHFYHPSARWVTREHLWAGEVVHLFEECELCILVLQLLADKFHNRNLCLNTDVVLVVGSLVFQQLEQHLTTALASSCHVGWLRSKPLLGVLPDHLSGDGV